MKKKFIVPDHKEPSWTIGAETFTRQEVYSLLWTQIAMISNDIKTVTPQNAFKTAEVSRIMDILKEPRTPTF